MVDHCDRDTKEHGHHANVYLYTLVTVTYANG